MKEYHFYDKRTQYPPDLKTIAHAAGLPVFSLTKRAKIIALCVAILVGLPVFTFSIVFVTGGRIFVVQPIGMLPDGVTAIVYDFPGLNFIDSPDALCYRTGGEVTLFCRGAIVKRVLGEGCMLGFGPTEGMKKSMAEKCFSEAAPLTRLPYSSLLYFLTGAPETYR